MLDPKTISDAEQASAMLAEVIPTILWGFYSNCVKEGFTRRQSFTLTRDLLSIVLPKIAPNQDE